MLQKVVKHLKMAEDSSYVLKLNFLYLKVLGLGTASVSQMTRLASLLSSDRATVTGPEWRHCGLSGIWK